MKFLRTTIPTGAIAYLGPILFAIVLAVITTFQLDWLNRMRDTDQESMLRSASQAAESFRDQFDREIAHLYNQFQIATTSPTAAAGRLEACYNAFNERLNHNNLLDRIYFLTLEDGEMGVREYLPWEGALVSCAWPGSLQSLEESFQRLAVNPRATDLEPLQGQGTGLLIPCRDSNETSRAWVLVTLNQNYLLSHLVPDLARTHLLRGTKDVFKLGIVAPDRPDKLLYRSDSEIKASDLATHDLALPLFSINRHFQIEAEPLTSSKFTDGNWRLLVRHRDGSLLSAANRVRNQRAAVLLSATMIVALLFMLPVFMFHHHQHALDRQLAYFSGLSHDLRAPLSVISSAAFNLSRGIVTDSARIREYGALMRTESSRLQEMVNHVMEHARSQSQENMYFLESKDPAELVSLVVEEHMGLLQKYQFEVSLSFEPEIPRVMIDTRALKSAIGNLITNAVKYGADGQWMGIRLYAEGGQVHVAVSDHGNGIAVVDQSHIFEPYYRAESARASGIEGSGLGLNMVKTIVKRHGGKVALDSKVGETTFTLSLPTLDNVKQRTEAGGLFTWKKRFS